MPRRLVLFVVAVATVFVLVTVVAAPPAVAAGSESEAVMYRPPVEGPIIDRFDPPSKPWLAGNRGIDYGVAAGTPVMAAADGEVVFSGPVAGALHVTVLHADGLRTTYSFLNQTSVGVGQRVRAGQQVGVTGGAVHVGVRTPDDTYLDPEALFAGSLEPRVRLVPGAEDGRDPLAERRSLWGTLFDTGTAALAHLQSRAGEWVELAAHYLSELDPLTHGARFVRAVVEWVEQRFDCTPASAPVPLPSGRRIAVVVSGLGTGSDGNSAWEIDTATLGYGPDDVVRFSYQGGQAPPAQSGPSPSEGATVEVRVAEPDDGGLADIPVHPFTAADSQQDLEVSADRLEVLLATVARAEPGVPIDVIAHSQGGVVARLGVVEAGAAGTLPTTVENLVTVGTPHQGAPLATGALALQQSATGRVGLGVLRAADVVPDLDDRLPATTQLSETSPVLEHMRELEIPPGVRFTSLGGAGDITVPGTATADPQADTHLLIPTPVGIDAHGDLTTMPETTREIGLAVAGKGPTCQSVWDAGSAFAEAELVRGTETAGALGLAVAGAAIDTAPAPLVIAGATGD